MCRCDAYASYWHAFGWLRHAVARVLCPGFLAIRLLPCTVSRLSLDSTVFVFLRTPVSLMKALKASSWRFSDIHPHLQFAMTCDWKWGVMWNMQYILTSCDSPVHRPHSRTSAAGCQLSSGEDLRAFVCRKYAANFDMHHSICSCHCYDSHVHILCKDRTPVRVLLPSWLLCNCVLQRSRYIPAFCSQGN